MQHKSAFYPCCANDFSEPYQLLKEIADHITFCDSADFCGLNWLEAEWRKACRHNPEMLSQAELVIEDVTIALEKISRIDVFFYRRDGEGEGGSGTGLLDPNRKLLDVLSRFPKHGGIIITDGSNTEWQSFEKMKSTSGYDVAEFNISPNIEQPYFAQYNLWLFNVKKVYERKQNSHPHWGF
ncbi:hypothetical protein FEF65_10025 [Mariprofundus erugo]|uniref:Uncharacterized protein n=1 Tax=Mariprofundus erugo TaxID=2528639 RepID=A0A5R9GID8_9PROT|nr:hypothetical protein [Mariprofundus erugo]TLS66496.1 hypothetical protein FEF65_10025 [Mariprofundus erugo]